MLLSLFVSISSHLIDRRMGWFGGGFYVGGGFVDGWNWGASCGRMDGWMGGWNGTWRRSVLACEHGICYLVVFVGLFFIYWSCSYLLR